MRRTVGIGHNNVGSKKRKERVKPVMQAKVAFKKTLSKRAAASLAMLPPGAG